MKKILLCFALVFLTLNTLFAQRDTDHWFAPMITRAGTGQQALYFSTDSLTPFPIEIFNNGALIGTVNVSKGSPITFPVPIANIITSSQSDLFTPITKGLYTKGTKPYYANFRFSIPSHGEILTSKGKAGIGTKFYAVVAPLTQTSSIYNFMTGILATEDNTVVTVSGYGAGVNFSNNTTGATNPTLNFTLNKGQSYIIEGIGSQSGNQTGFIGAKIVSTKPISVTNGNFNGQFSLDSFDGSDIVMDQSVPVDRLGSEFILVKGNGNISKRMEDALIVATEDNTQIFVNGSITPAATINEGQFYRVNAISNTNYIDQGNDHYNMHLRTSKNVYVYQLLAGVATSSATLGFNYIPPLNCYLPRKIDEIGNIADLNGVSNNVKLNIITEAGAVVTYNGGPIAATSGPFPVTGTTSWVSYSIPQVTGNATITSTKAVTAGISGGSGVVGYGGYFAGFSSIPVIAKQTGDCIPGIILEVDDSFETYQWFLGGVAITGATSNTYTPTIPGSYTVTVTIGSCPPLTTPVYQVFNCLIQTTQGINICGSKVITPVFTSSSQTPVPSTVVILTQPLFGTATVNSSTGAITYIPNAGYLGPDKIVYKFCGNAALFVDCEQITLNLTVIPFIVSDKTIFACQYAGKGYFDLNSANVTDTVVPFVRKYYPTLNDLNNNTNEILNPTNYFSAAGSVYVKVTTSEGCEGKAKITLDFYPSPVTNDATLNECFLEISETQARFNLNSAVVSSQSSITKKFYPTFTDASNGTNEIPANIAANYISGDATVFVRVISAQTCYTIAKITLKVIPPKRSAQLVDKFICIDERTTLDAGPGYQSYTWSTGAITQSIQGVAVGEYWVQLKDNGCTVKQFVSVKKVQDPVITSIEIANNTATVIATGGTPPYQYSVDGTSTWQNSNLFTNLSRGQHTFYVKDAYNCTPVSTEITVPNLINAITPNGDNKNDFIDYSELAYKGNLVFVIYDRYGNKIFTGDKFNNFRWDGKHFDKSIITGTYWYHITWIEPNALKTPVKYTGWILVKNRE